MTDFHSREDSSASIAILPGGGSAGVNWQRATALLPARVLPLPDLPRVEDMAAALAPNVAELAEPRVLVGASLGGMVAMEIARSVAIQGLVMIAAGFGIAVGDSFLQWLRTNPPDLYVKLARLSMARDVDERSVTECALDFETRGHDVILRHLEALSVYRPEPLTFPPATLVIWGEYDRAVPLADHVELAQKCHGVLAPISGAGHMPFFERPVETVSWIRWAAECGFERASNTRNGHSSK